MQGRKSEIVRLRHDGAGADRSVVQHVFWRARRPGDGLHLPRRIGRAETEVVAADGAPRKDRLFRPDRTAGRLGSSRRADDDRQTRGRYLGPQRRKEMDRQRSMVRSLDHLGARSGGQPGQGLHRREQDHAGLQRREDRAQDRSQGRAERSHHPEGLPRAGSQSPAGRQLIPRHCPRAAHDALHGGLDGDGMPDGSLRKRAQVFPASDCNSESRSARFS